MVLPAGPLPRTQVLNNDSFIPPPLDGQLMVPQFYDFHLKHNPDYPIFAFSDADGSEEVATWKQATRSVYGIANDVRRRVGREANVRGKPQTVVAILTASGESIAAHLCFVLRHESTLTSLDRFHHVLSQHCGDMPCRICAVSYLSPQFSWSCCASFAKGECETRAGRR
jgi:hypothetical protein